MGVQIGAKNLTPHPRPKVEWPDYGIEHVITGSDYATMYGNAFLYQEQYAADYAHGRIRLCEQHAMDILAAWGNTPRICEPESDQTTVFLDTETSGLAGGTGTYAFLVGIGYRTPAGFELVQFFMRDPDQESAMLAALDQWLARFNVVVTFNGKTFDIPLLNTRYTMNGLSAPFENYQHLDVLHIARRLWRDRLPSRALSELEKEIVRFFRTQDEVPGWLIPQLYFDYLRSGDARPLAGVFYHNAKDILSLAALYGHIADMLTDPLGQAVDDDIDMASIARLYEDMGWLEQAAAIYERSLESGDMPEDIFIKTMQRFALLRRRKGEWEKAVLLWRTAADHGDIAAYVELSKYYEHRVRNNMEALNWARKALETLDADRFFPGNRSIIERELGKRVHRLYQRVYEAFDEEE